MGSDRVSLNWWHRGDSHLSGYGMLIRGHHGNHTVFFINVLDCLYAFERERRVWACAIEDPEFMAYPLVCTNCFTFGGIRVSPRAQVVNTDGYEIPGLYAAGEVIGLYYGSYVGSTSFLKGIVFGRIAGKHAPHRSKMVQGGAKLRVATE
jgi:hypothetical protein